jgi:hypothetical protein
MSNDTLRLTIIEAAGDTFEVKASNPEDTEQPAITLAYLDDEDSARTWCVTMQSNVRAGATPLQALRRTSRFRSQQ